jgi:cell division protein FtsB
LNRRLLGGAALFVVVGALSLYGISAVIRVSQLQRDMDTLERDLVTLRARAETLTRTVDRLRTDPAYIEKLAREDLGYVREGETVLKFPKAAPAAPNTAPAR